MLLPASSRPRPEMLLNSIPGVGQRIVQSISSVRVERRCSSVVGEAWAQKAVGGLLEALGHWPHCSHEDGERSSWAP